MSKGRPGLPATPAISVPSSCTLISQTETGTPRLILRAEAGSNSRRRTWRSEGLGRRVGRTRTSRSLPESGVMMGHQASCPPLLADVGEARGGHCQVLQRQTGSPPSAVIPPVSKNVFSQLQNEKLQSSTPIPFVVQMEGHLCKFIRDGELPVQGTHSWCRPETLTCRGKLSSPAKSRKRPFCEVR